MSKDVSVMVKGLAILLMLVLHLFNKSNLTELCQPLIYVGDVPLVKWLAAACNPVAFFLILSGYGLSFIHSRGCLTYKGQGRRIVKLYVHYWIILVVFVGLGCVLRPDRYPGNWQEVVGNLTNWISTYNPETWFLLPYVCIAMTSPVILKIVDKLGNTLALICTFVLHLGSAYIVSRYIATGLLTNRLVELIVIYFEFYLSFVIGAVMHRIAERGELRPRILTQNTALTIGLIVILVVAKCLLNSSLRPLSTIIHPFYAALLILLFICLPFGKCSRAFFTALGHRSMVIWMTHTFFSVYLFSDFIYGMRYPLLIFAVTLAVSYAVSIPIMWAAQQINSRLFPMPSPSKK